MIVGWAGTKWLPSISEGGCGFVVMKWLQLRLEGSRDCRALFSHGLPFGTLAIVALQLLAAPVHHMQSSEGREGTCYNISNGHA
jgi:hypothetical protein